MMYAAHSHRWGCAVLHAPSPMLSLLRWASDSFILSALPLLAATMPMQEFFEETAEYEAGVHAGQRRRVAGLSRRKSLAAPKEQTFDVPGAVSCYCRCMQHMLQASMAATVLPQRSPHKFLPRHPSARHIANGKVLVGTPGLQIIRRGNRTCACCHAHLAWLSL